MRLTRGRTGDHGFTLVELTVVVMLLGLLVGIAVASWQMSTERARVTACEANRQAIELMIAEYRTANGGENPPDLDALAGQVRGDRWRHCMAYRDVDLDYDPVSGRVSCPRHP